MFRPTISQLIHQLTQDRDRQGDLEVVAYNEKLGHDLETIDTEVNADGPDGIPVLLLTVSRNGE